MAAGVFVYTKNIYAAILCLYNKSHGLRIRSCKDESNLDKHGLSLADADGFEWETAVVCEDERQQYAERRFEAKGYIGGRRM